MRTIIAGSRDITDYQALLDLIKTIDWEITGVVSGTARGVDIMGELWAAEHDIPVKKCPASWNTYGYAAGPIRNLYMAQNAEACIVLCYKHSRGSKSMIKIAKEHNLKLKVKYLEEE